MRALARSLLALIVLVLLAAGGAYFYLQRSLPQTEGTLRLAGPHAPIEILRDAYGIPHIFARNTEDAAFGLGFVHAQDRLWQMEMSRRIAAGRLAEILGPAALPTDEFLRTLGIYRAAQATLAHLEPGTRRALDAYAAGVNAFIATRPVLPIEFWLTRDRFAPWTPADTIGWVKMMAWELGGNWRTELLRVRLAKTLSPAQIEQLLPPYPGDAPLKIRDLKDLYGGLAKQARALARIAPPANGPASNNWVVSGAHSATGKPLLANDPHLGLSAPSVWYLAQISAPGLDAIGATFPGVPMVVLGHNDRIAWGFTNTGADVQDLYIEKLDGHGNYLTPEGWRPLSRIDETIKVRGGDDVHLTVRQTRHGPLISDVLRSAGNLAPPGYGIAMQWTALRDDDRTVEAGLKMLRAGNWKEFLAAVREFDSPQQNMVYADVDGHIGFIAAGRVPIRKPENDLHGLAPAPGWDAKYDWVGFIPFDQLPQLYDSPNGEIYSANNKITPPGYGPFITSEWEPPYRAKRIAELLAAVLRHTISSFARMQGDVVSLAARELLPRMSATHPASEQAQLALELLAHWDGSMSAGRTRAADLHGLVAGARARDLRRRARRRVPRQLAAAPGIPQQRALRQGRRGTLVRRRAHQSGRDLRPAALGLARCGARRPAHALRQGHDALALGRRSPSARRAPALRPQQMAREDLRHPRADAGRRLYARSGCGRFRRRRSVRQPQGAQPARNLRPVGAAEFAVHRFHRPVGQRALAALSRLRRSLGARRLHPDDHRPRAARGRAPAAPGAGARALAVRVRGYAAG